MFASTSSALLPKRPDVLARIARRVAAALKKIQAAVATFYGPAPDWALAMVNRLDEVLNLDVARAHRFFEEHVGRITLTPNNEDPKPVYAPRSRHGSRDRSAPLHAGP